MEQRYVKAHTRRLRPDEKLIVSQDCEMPLVIEAKNNRDLTFLKQLLADHSEQILADISRYGAVLLRGFEVKSDQDFEQVVLSIRGLQGIRDAFMSEEGRTQVGDLQYVLHTNAAYKTGGTLYLGGFHSENYYSPDVPGYICFHCQQPSKRGGETGLINMRKVYQYLPPALKEKLEKNTFFVSKWLISDISRRYQIPAETIKKIAQQFDLPILGKGKNQFVAFYKPSVYINPETQQRSLQINLFELATLNPILRQRFMADYAGKDWFWHRLVWRLPASLLKALEKIYLAIGLLIYSRKEYYEACRSKMLTFLATRKLDFFETTRVGHCFTDDDIELLAALIRQYYVSCLWQEGDILLVDNTQVAHAGMPGAGHRKIRAMICNPLVIPYTHTAPGTVICKEREEQTIGHAMSQG